MSVVINGELHQIESLVNLLHNYKALCAKEETCHSIDKKSITLVNKYYSAQLTLSLIEFSNDCRGDISIFDNAEGYILIPSATDSDLSLPKYSLAAAALDADTGLRLLVVIVNGTEGVHRRACEEWALENGFEYIEVDTDDPTKDHQKREKYGLPRLIEALESNMWSTMQRAPRASAASSSATTAASSSSSAEEVAKTLEATSLTAETSTYTPPTLATQSSVQPTESSSSLPLPPPSTTAAASTTTSRVDAPAAAVDPFEQEMEDKEENEIVDKYADFISEVKSFREQATGGQLPDQARRDQAAEMALRLAQLMGMDDESDSESSV